MCAESHSFVAPQDHIALWQLLAMLYNLFEQYLGSSTYSPLDQDGMVEEPLQKDIFRHFGSSKQSRYCYLILSAILITLAGAAGYLLGTLKNYNQCEIKHLVGTVIRGRYPSNNLIVSPAYLLDVVPIGSSHEIFQYNSSFAAPPPKEGGSEPVWDSMIPSKSDISLTLVRKV